MRGPAPKDPAVRRRRNVQPTADVLDGGALVERPELPARGPGEQPWHPQTVAWWNDLWSSPMARRYLQADIHGLFVGAVLLDQFWHQPSATKAAEVRRQLEQYGLSVMSRRRLDWRVRDDEPAAPSGTTARPAAAPKRRPDPRDTILRLVDGSRR